MITVTRTMTVAAAGPHRVRHPGFKALKLNSVAAAAAPAAPPAARRAGAAAGDPQAVTVTVAVTVPASLDARPSGPAEATRPGPPGDSDGGDSDRDSVPRTRNSEPTLSQFKTADK